MKRNFIKDYISASDNEVALKLLLGNLHNIRHANLHKSTISLLFPVFCLVSLALQKKKKKIQWSLNNKSPIFCFWKIPEEQEIKH